MITSGKHDPSLAQELEEERTPLIEEAGKRGPSQAQDERTHAHANQEGCPLTREIRVRTRQGHDERNAGAHALPGLVVKGNESAHTRKRILIYRESKV